MESDHRRAPVSRPADQLDPAQWVDRHGDVLYRYALLRVRRSDVAAEIVQETFLDALRGRERFSGASSERTWLVGILKHKLVDHYRREVRQRREGGDDVEPAIDATAVFDEEGWWVADPLPWKDDPLADIERREFWEVIGQCLAHLPPKLADAFSLRELEGLAGEEICRVLHISPDNLWARLHRARLLLRGCLERHWFGGDEPRALSVGSSTPASRERP